MQPELQARRELQAVLPVQLVLAELKAVMALPVPPEVMEQTVPQVLPVILGLRVPQAVPLALQGARALRVRPVPRVILAQLVQPGALAWPVRRDLLVM